MSSRTRLTRLIAGGAVAVGSLVAGAVPAGAHVSIAESELAAGERGTVTFGFGHGCEDSPTTRLRIQIPESVPAPQPVVQAGWSIEMQREPLAEPIEAGHGEMLTERVTEIAFTAETPVDGAYRASVQLSMTAPDEAGTTLFFPVVQECVEGATNWTQVPAEGQDPDELDSPAPGVAIVAGTDEGHGDSGSDDTTDTTEASEAGETTTTEASSDASTTDDASDDDGGSQGLAIAGLVAGVLGVGVGGRALAVASKRQEQ